jgi:type I restriction enzyme, S subunit
MIDKFNIDKSSWIPVKFGDVVKEPKESIKDPVAAGVEHVVGLEHIDPGSVHLKRSAGIEESTTFTKKFSIGDVLFGRRRAYLKKAAQASFDGICSGDITVFRAKADLMPELLPFIVQNDNFFDYAIEHSAGGLSPRVKFKDLANYEFLLPPKEQHAELAELLWAMDIVVEKNNVTLTRLESFYTVNTLELLGLKNYCGDKNWETKKLIDIAPLQRGFDLTNKALREGVYPVCYSNGISNHHVEYKVKGPGVCTGRSGTIGNVFYIEEDYWPHNTTLWVTDFKENDPEFIYFLYSNLNFDKLMTGTGVPTLNRNDLHKVAVKIPRHDEQLVIRNQISFVEDKIKLAIEKLDSSKSLQKSLINQVF